MFKHITVLGNLKVFFCTLCITHTCRQTFRSSYFSVSILNLLTAKGIKMTRFHKVHFHVVEFTHLELINCCKLKPYGYVSELFDSKRDDLRKNIYTSQASWSLSAWLGETDDWVHSAVWFCRVLDTLACHFSTWFVSFAQQNETQLTSSFRVLLWGFASPCRFTALVVLHSFSSFTENYVEFMQSFIFYYRVRWSSLLNRSSCC